MVSFIDIYRAEYGVEPICKILPIAPSTFYRHARSQARPEFRSARAKRDETLQVEIRRVWMESGRRYGSYKVWKQLLSENQTVARCTVERLMRTHGLVGVRRGRPPRTSIRSCAKSSDDLVHRQFKASAPNRLWVADITYVRTRSGFVFVAFVVDVFSRRIVGWKVSTSLHRNLPLGALEQALSEREERDNLIHHSDRGAQCLSIVYSKRLEEAGVEASVGSVGDSYDNALAETINGLYKAEVINHQGPWEGHRDVERATLDWVHWFNTERLYGPLGYVSPVRYEELFYHRHAIAKKAA